MDGRIQPRGDKQGPQTPPTEAPADLLVGILHRAGLGGSEMHADPGHGRALGWTRSWAWTIGRGLVREATCFPTGRARPGFGVLQGGHTLRAEGGWQQVARVWSWVFRPVLRVPSPGSRQELGGCVSPGGPCVALGILLGHEAQPGPDVPARPGAPAPPLPDPAAPRLSSVGTVR